MTTKKKNEERPRRAFVYIGQRRWASGFKLAHCYLPVDAKTWETDKLPTADEENESACIFKKPIAKYARPGEVFSIEHDPEKPGTVTINTAETLGHYDKERCALWQSLSQAHEDAYRAEALAKKEKGRDIPLEVLSPLRAAYGRLRNKNERAVFLGRVIANITRGLA